MTRPNSDLDAVVIAGNVPDEYLGKDAREKVRLTVDGIPASLQFLLEYFRSGDNAAAATRRLESEGTSFLSINGPYLCRFLAQHGFSAELVQFCGLEPERLRALLERKPRAVVISTTFLPFAAHIDAIATAVKKISPTSTVIAGGPQVWKSYAHLRLLHEGAITPDIAPAVAEHNYFIEPNRPSPVDIFVVSDSGEATLVRILERLRRNEPCRDIENTAIWEDGRWRIAPIVPEPEHEVFVDWGRFVRPGAGPYVPVQAGQGCAFRCAFCDFTGLRPVRRRGPDSILAEIRSIPPAADGLRRVYFTDDNLFATAARAREICTALAQSGLNLRWRGMFRASVVTPEIAERLARSGCLEVLLGIESGDAGILARMGKRTTPDGILKAIETLSRAGIHTKSTFIVGFPGETAASVANTVALVNAYPTDLHAAHRCMFFRFGVLPLSDVASPESRKRYGLRGYGYHWRHHTMTSDEAVAHLETIHDLIKPEVSPSYVLEVPELPGLSVAQLRQVYALRTRISRVRRGLPDTEAEPDLWRRLREQFADARASTPPSTPSPRSGPAES